MTTSNRSKKKLSFSLIAFGEKCRNPHLIQQNNPLTTKVFRRFFPENCTSRNLPDLNCLTFRAVPRSKPFNLQLKRFRFSGFLFFSRCKITTQSVISLLFPLGIGSLLNFSGLFCFLFSWWRTLAATIGTTEHRS